MTKKTRRASGTAGFVAVDSLAFASRSGGNRSALVVRLLDAVRDGWTVGMALPFTVADIVELSGNETAKPDRTLNNACWQIRVATKRDGAAVSLGYRQMADGRFAVIRKS